MALVKCKECGNAVSNKAAACPSCGAKVPKQVGILGIILVGLVTLPMFIGMFSKNDYQKPAKTPEQNAADLAINKDENSREKATIGAIRAIRYALRDPKSLEFLELQANNDGTIVCAEYTARNGFGGTNRQSMAFIAGKAYADSESWSSFCMTRMKDMKYLAKYAD